MECCLAGIVVWLAQALVATLSQTETIEKRRSERISGEW
jgi:hypothetical protein